MPRLLKHLQSINHLIEGEQGQRQQTLALALGVRSETQRIRGSGTVYGVSTLGPALALSAVALSSVSNVQGAWRAQELSNQKARRLRRDAR